MRAVAFGLLAFSVSLTLCAPGAPAQPTKPNDPNKLVIRPGGSGAVPVPNGLDPLAKPGFIVIRPNGKLPSAQEPPTPVPEPKRPQNPLETQPARPAALDVPAPTDKLDADTAFDYWFAASVEGQRLGYVQWGAKRTKKNDRVLLVGIKYQNFTLARFGQVVNQWGEESTVELEDGSVLVTGVRQGIGKDQALVLSGMVEGKTLRVTGGGAAKGATDKPFPEGVVGVVREPALFKTAALKIGESYSYPAYVGVLNVVVKMTMTLEAEETLTLWQKDQPRKLLRYITKMEPVDGFKLPPAYTWVDAATFEPLKMEFEFPGFGGKVTFLRTTKAAATAPVTRPVELFNVQSIRLDREIAGIHGGRSVVYKVSAPKDEDPKTLFASDARQEVKNFDPATKTFELHVRGSRGPQNGGAKQPAPGKEFTASNYFLCWDDDRVKAHATAAVKGLPFGASDWDKAVAVEKWVKANMKAFEFSQAMATADNVAKTLNGDCTEYAMLSAAMCRSLGVPSRTVLGLVYAPARDGKPFLAYHMWFEAYAGEQWLPLDATLGLGGVGPGHVKIADHSWHDEKTFAPLLPVLRTLSAKPAVSVAKWEP